MMLSWRRILDARKTSIGTKGLMRRASVLDCCSPLQLSTSLAAQVRQRTGNVQPVAFSISYFLLVVLNFHPASSVSSIVPI